MILRSYSAPYDDLEIFGNELEIILISTILEFMRNDIKHIKRKVVLFSASEDEPSSYIVIRIYKPTINMELLNILENRTISKSDIGRYEKTMSLKEMIKLLIEVIKDK